MKITLDTGGTIAEDTALVIGELVDSETKPKHKPAFTPVSDELSDSGYGNFTVNHDGVWLFDLDNSHPDVQALAVDQTLTDTFEFSYIDKKGDIHYESIVLTITGTNDTPIAHAAVAGVDEPINADDVAFAAGKVEATDVDNGAVVKFYDTSLPQHGTINMDEDGNWTYIVDSGSEAVHALNVGDTLTDTINFVAIDEHGAESSSTLTIIINGTNDEPIAQEASASVDEPINADDVAFAAGKVEAIDLDSDAVVKFYDTSLPQYGTISMAEDGNWTYIVDSGSEAVHALNVGDTLTDTIDFVAIDEHGAESASTLTIIINGTNDEPIAQEASASVDEPINADDVAFAAGKVEATDVDNDAVVKFYDTSLPQYGTISMAEDGNWTYIVDSGSEVVHALNVGDTLTEEIDFVALDEHGAESTAVLTITIVGTNDEPIAQEVFTTVDEPINTDDVAFAAGKVEAIDLDSNAVVKFYDTSLPQHGTITMAEDGNWTYIVNSESAEVQALNEGDFLLESIDFVALDEHGAESTSSINITIVGTNDAPVAEEGFATIAEGTPLVIGELVATDVDEGSSLTFTPVSDVLSDSGYGNFTVNHDGVWLYDLHSDHPEVDQLAIGDTLEDSFEYIVTDENGASTYGEITVLITGTNDAPVATPGFETITEGTPLVIGELEAYDVDLGSSISYTPVSDVTSDTGYGNFTVNHDGIWLYDLHSDHAEVAALNAGETLIDSFEYTVTDEHGAESVGTLEVTITGTDNLPVVAAAGSNSEGSTAALLDDEGAGSNLEVVVNDGSTVDLDAPAAVEVAAAPAPAPVEVIAAAAPPVALPAIDDDAAAAAANAI